MDIYKYENRPKGKKKKMKIFLRLLFINYLRDSFTARANIVDQHYSYEVL